MSFRSLQYWNAKWSSIVQYSCTSIWDLKYTFFLFFFFWFLLLPGCSFKGYHLVLSWSPGPECTEQFWLKGWVFIADMFQASHKQWEVAILILINTSTLIKFRIVEMDNWLNLNKRPCWDSIRDPFASEANPWTAGLRYLTNSMLLFPGQVLLTLHRFTQALNFSETWSKKFKTNRKYNRLEKRHYHHF